MYTPSTLNPDRPHPLSNQHRCREHAGREILSRFSLQLRGARDAFSVIALIISLASYTIGYSSGQESSAQVLPDQQLKFRLILEGRGLKQGADAVSFARFESSDGTKVERRIEKYSSPSRAAKEIEHIVAESEKVIERGPNPHERKAHDGERVVLVARGALADLGKILIAWNDGPDVYVLQSSSQRCVQSFEKQFYK